VSSKRRPLRIVSRRLVSQAARRLPRAIVTPRYGSINERNAVGSAAVSFEGSAVQNAIYASGECEWPVTYEEWERLAREALEPGPFGYIAGGAGAEATVRANREAFERVRLRPRMLRGNVERELEVDVLGTRSPFPFLLAPVGVLSIAHAEGELAAARAAASAGVPFIVSSAASHSIEEVAEAMGDAPRWFQLYWASDREICASFVLRAASAGYAAIVVTVDTLVLGWRPRDLRNAYLPFVTGDGCAQFFSDPVFRSRLARAPEEDVVAAALAMLATFPNLALTWDDLRWLRDQTDLPLLVKGVLRGDDARRAVDAGADGVVVSNHGGRQVDGAVASLDALREVRGAIGGDTAVLVDGGVRGGADVLKALALGADAVLLGRPYVYGLAVGGQAGCEAVLRHLAAEIDLTLALVGGRSVGELDETWIAASS
jgi:lactate 2-monooxygenase